MVKGIECGSSAVPRFRNEVWWKRCNVLNFDVDMVVISLFPIHDSFYILCGVYCHLGIDGQTAS